MALAFNDDAWHMYFVDRPAKNLRRTVYIWPLEKNKIQINETIRDLMLNHCCFSECLGIIDAAMFLKSERREIQDLARRAGELLERAKKKQQF